jgi:hypothetical protein
MAMDVDEIAVKGCRNQRVLDPGELEKDMEKKNVDHDGSEQGQGQGYEIAGQQGNTNKNLGDGNCVEQVPRFLENA